MLRNPIEGNPYVARFANQPAFIQPGSESWLSACLQQHNAVDKAREAEFMGPFEFEGYDTRADRPYGVVNGVAVIPIRGALLHGSMARYSSATGYDYIRSAAFAAEADPDVRGIAYLHNSNGGEVAGNLDLAADLKNLAKPSVAIVDENAYSASYSLASAADRIVVARTGGVGSIGVVTAHLDISKMLENFGVKFTFVHAGKHKVDGNPMQALGDDAKNRMQARIDGLYNQFVSTVSGNRNLSGQDVRSTEALTYPAEDAVAMGLADAVMPPREALAAFIDDVNRKPSGANTMTTQIKAANTEQAPALSEADLAAARADGAKAERERIQGIQGCEAAKTRPVAAQQLAYKTDMSVEAASEFLAGLPEEKSAGATETPEITPAVSQPNAFQQAMDSTLNPQVGADAGNGDGQGENPAQRIIASFAGVTGRKAK